MTIGAIDPYDVAIRVDIGEIQETDLPKIFSGDTKGLAECKRHLYKLRSDRILYTQLALVDLMQKLKFATSPEALKEAVKQATSTIQETLKKNLEHQASVNATLVKRSDSSIEYFVSRTDKWRRDGNKSQTVMQEDVILRIKNTVSGSTITPMEGWNNVISKKTFNKVVGQVRKINLVNERVLGTFQRRKVELDILENETIPFMSKMWAIGVIGDILDMLGKALGGNL